MNELLAKGRRLPQRLLGVESRLLLWLLAAGLLVLLFLGLASEMAEGETLAWDRAVLLALRQPGDLAMPIGPPWLAKSLKDITALGGGAVLTLVTAIVAGYLLASRRAALAGFLVLSVAGGSIVGTLLKHLFGRDRPTVVPHLVDVQTLSFPSGHAFNSAIVYLTLGALLARTQQRRAVKVYILACAFFLAAIIGFSRVYLGVHYPSDVVAGWCAGAAWAGISVTVARRLQHGHQLEGAD
ncbi:MAG TPA: phosphatase PAP2 family protein [Sphingomicrobium sp.]